MWLRSSCAALSLLALLAAAPAAATTLPAGVEDLSGPLEPVGSARVDWFTLPLYDARLWAPGGEFQPGATYALDLEYLRDIPARRIVDASIAEMRRLGTPGDTQLQHWRQLLSRILPDVRRGDRLVGVALPGRGAWFFNNKGFIGSVEDDEFSRRFFAIWLDPRTREPGARAGLLGVPP